MIEHYFVTAWLPSDENEDAARVLHEASSTNGLYAAGVIVPVGTIAPGATGEVRVPLYVGPQDQDVLAKTAKGLDLVVDYGIFTVIAAPLFWLLKWLHGLIGNWGWAIIVMTIMIKGAFYPLNAAAARSMGKMKIIAPKMKALQEQYANDKQQLQIKMMEMYKTEKINPLGGCLPILVQIPVFIALYWVLLSAVELRQAPWILWIHDLSAPDPYFVLPVIYAITAYLQVKLSPTPITDPVQAKVMQIMPIAFSVLFIFFPSGLVLYWLVNNILQIAQQWHMNRMLEREAAARRRSVGRRAPIACAIASRFRARDFPGHERSGPAQARIECSAGSRALDAVNGRRWRSTAAPVATASSRRGKLGRERPPPSLRHDRCHRHAARARRRGHRPRLRCRARRADRRRGRPRAARRASRRSRRSATARARRSTRASCCTSPRRPRTPAKPSSSSTATADRRCCASCSRAASSWARGSPSPANSRSART